MPEVLKRVEAVRAFRLKSKSASKLAQSPTQFHVTNIPQSNFMVIPEVSSSHRAYIPIAFMHPEDGLCSNLVKLFPEAELFHFSVLSSSVHMVWVKTVCGRLKMDYRYSTELVYNTFPWPQEVDSKLKKRMEAAAQAILDARTPDATLAQLYAPAQMPSDLRQAHETNDRLVMQAYGFDPNWSKNQIFTGLYRIYQQLIAAEAIESAQCV